MSLNIESDLRLEFEGHELSLRDDGDGLVAEFSSLSAVRHLRRTLKVGPGKFPPACRLPDLDEITARVVVRGRTVANLDTTGHSANVKFAWWGLIATLLHLPG